VRSPDPGWVNCSTESSRTEEARDVRELCVGTKLVAVGRSFSCGALSRFGVDASGPDGHCAKPGLIGEDNEVRDD
jgi:hypothetical protein